MKKILNVGIDVGSTTVKATVLDAVNNDILWKKYLRHNTKQIETTRDFLLEISKIFPDSQLKLFITGSGGRAIAPHIHAVYVQEVNAVTFAVEKRFPQIGSVIELGGQDAKIIIWKEDKEGRKSTLTFMNDKCAGGTGATIDKILGKIGISQEEAAAVSAKGKTRHHIAAKCGVFAETDIVGLIKSGVDKEEIVVSLCEAIARQNLEVLVRGNELRDKVLLLGGPHSYFTAFEEVWRELIPQTWELHGWSPRNLSLEELIFVPEDSQYFAAIGAVLFGIESQKLQNPLLKGKQTQDNIFPGIDKLDNYMKEGRTSQMMSSGAVRDGLVQSDEEVHQIKEKFSIPSFKGPELQKGASYSVYLGIDGGSTSSKLVLLDQHKELFYKDYILSHGNPVKDLKLIFQSLLNWKKENQIKLEIKGTAVTGYASEILSKAFNLDLHVVETIAHMRSALSLYGDVDVICDVGGQDIKVLFLKHGRVIDFKLNTQCSAGNGYFLQAMAQQFDIPIEKYAETAFRARKAPAFNYGCAVFMEQDRVNFQQLGWSNEEIMAGLALVLPLNIWNYVVQEPHIARFGKNFVLQGGTQKNLAAVKAQVDYIKNKVENAQVHIHKYADIAGAIGAAIELIEQKQEKPSCFIGLEAASKIEFQTRNDQSTRCSFCNNHCPRTFIDIKRPDDTSVRFISGYGCEKGQSESLEKMKHHQKELALLKEQVPDLVDYSSRIVFEDFDFKALPKAGSKIANIHRQTGFNQETSNKTVSFERSNQKMAQMRSEMAIGIPKLLNLFYYAPFFNVYFRVLGCKKIVYSDFTSSKLWEKGNKWGAIDPCFPAKVAPAHIYNLMEKKEISHICFPMITHLESIVENVMGNNACVIQMGTPEVTEAVFTRDKDRFKEKGLQYWKPIIRMDRPLEAEGLLWDYFGERLGITKHENAWAVKQAYQAMDHYLADLREKGRQLINNLIDNNKMGILILGHPYHHDPGLNHGIPQQFRMRGFPVLCIESLPIDHEFLDPLFNQENKKNKQDYLGIGEIWERNFNRNTNLKFWAAKIASRHPNLAVIDLSSFKCGHDAPTYSYIDNLLDSTETAHFLFHDIDQNKPRASINIRIQTIEYFLHLEEQKLLSAAKEHSYA